MADGKNTAITRQAEKGNVIMIVLIGVILFAALSFAVSDMIRSASPEAVSEQKAPLLADGVLNYARVLRQGVQDMRINGCSDGEISFENQTVAGYEHSPVARDACKLFNAAGGSAIYSAPQNDWMEDISSEWYFPANICVPGIGTADTGCDSDGEDNESLIAFLPNIRADVCRSINDKLGYGSIILTETGDAWPSAETLFTGSYTDDVSLDQNGRMAGCFEGAGTPPSGTYHFFQVLLVR